MEQGARLMALQRAVKVMGTADKLAVRLGVSLRHLDYWLQGKAPIPYSVLLRIIDVVTDAEEA